MDGVEPGGGDGEGGDEGDVERAALGAADVDAEGGFEGVEAEGHGGGGGAGGEA